MKYWFCVLLLHGLIFTVMPTHAEWVTVTGSGTIKDGDVATARHDAMADALQQTSLLFAAQAHGAEHLPIGQFSEFRVGGSTMSGGGLSKSTIKDMVVRTERVGKNTIEVVYDVDVYSANYCDSATAGGYRKLVGMLGFVLQTPGQAAIGGLYDIERGLSATLTQLLTNSGFVLPRSANQIKLYSDVLNAPTRETQQRTLSNAVAEAHELGVQFVVSGIVRSVAMHDEQSLNSSLLDRSVRLLNLSELRREFVVDLFIHDGFSGAIIFEQRYVATGMWEGERVDKIRFMSPTFNQYEYGQQVGQKMQQMAVDIQRVVSCQPFMARITRVEDKVIQFASGANSGIRPGDKFQLYRSRQLHVGTQFQGTQLTAVKQVLQVSLVHPEFSAGTLNVDPSRINIQEDDVLVRW